MTNVKFYREDTSVLAVFPDDIADGQFKLLCYAHLGQHSVVCKEYLKGKKLAKKDEYTPLLNELKGQGYDDLNVLNKK